MDLGIAGLRVLITAGAGGIGIIKVSGTKAMSLADTILRSSRNLSELQPHHLYHGYVIDPDTEKTIDEVLYVAMKAPHSYTREDVLEIQAHGSRCGLHRILELVLKQDIRMAEPGEFTKRAFLNGRIDLTQAEAVIDIINSRTEKSLEIATSQIQGGLRNRVDTIRRLLIDLLIETEAAIDISNDKQVIIFTHRLSLLGTIKHFAEKESIKPDVVSIRATDWGTGEPAPIPISQSDLKSALNVLINQRYQAAKKANDNGDFEQAEIFIKSICSDFRTLVERAIENDLLCGVVQRFQRPVHTLKLKDLAKLRESDCEMLDSLMTKYSGFEHSQPSESPIELPKPHELLADLIALKDWREDYSKRSVTPSI